MALKQKSLKDLKEIQFIYRQHGDRKTKVFLFYGKNDNERQARYDEISAAVRRISDVEGNEYSMKTHVWKD